MIKQINADYFSMYIFPPCLEDWVDHNHPARYIRAFVDSLDLEELGFVLKENMDGRPGYHPELLLKVVLYALAMRIRSLRLLERECRNNIGMIWLTGNQVPDHSTFCRFLVDNQLPLARINKKLIFVAEKSGILGSVFHVVDGTKIRSASSRKGTVKKEDLKRLLDELDRRTRDLVESASEDEEEWQLLPAHFTEEAMRLKIKEALQTIDEDGRDKVNPDEPEAKFMKTSDKSVDLCYNAQVVVDAKSGLIVAEDVCVDQADNARLIPMMEKAEENLGKVADETVGDAGFLSSRSLSDAEEKKWEVLVNLGKEKEDKEFDSGKFKYDSENNQAVCPLGNRLNFSGDDKDGHETFMIFHCSDYEECPRRFDCSDAKNGRSVKIGMHRESLNRQKLKQKEDEKRILLEKRGSVVENVFGNIKHNGGFRRFSRKGLKKVKMEWSLQCLANNLRKLEKHYRAGNLKLSGV